MDHPIVNSRASPCEDRQDWLLDQALAETFPASDPISPMSPWCD